MAAINGYTPVAAPAGTTPSKQTVPSAKTVDTQSVLKRLQSELMALMGTTYFAGKERSQEAKTLFLKEQNTNYRFPSLMTFKPPKVKFETSCFHPNVDVYGNICLDILQDKWSSAYDVRTILLSIQSLLGEPNISSPLNTQAAQLWSNQEEYRKMVEKLYKPPSAA
ncbi:hypothetical protein D5086_017874 [Populus alba]|uniref:Uncharacterized protein n=2 Tax=Populus alba TaxID=43335 RepID=A0ACC4BNJ1_POPAL|nr:hypothetical protein D5086_0000221040 [Populus alba]